MKVKTYTHKEQDEKVFETKLTGNKETFHLNIKVVKDGNVVHEERGNSFVANFMRMLAQSMAIGPIDESLDFDELIQPGSTKMEAWTWAALLLNNNGAPDTSAWPEPVTVTGWQDGNRVNVTYSTTTLNRSFPLQQSHYLYIPRGQNQGVYPITSAPSQAYVLDGLNADPSDDVGMLVIPVLPYNPQMGTNTPHLRAWKVLLGGDDTPVSLNDKWLLAHYDNDEMTPSGPIAVSPPVIADGVSRIAMSTTFTNNSGVEKTIREIGLLLRLSLHHTATSESITRNGYLTRDGNLSTWGSYTALSLGARDVVTPIPIQPSETFSIIYEIITSVAQDKSSGIMENFNELLYRQLASNARTSRNYLNEQVSAGVARQQLLVPENDNRSFGATVPYHRYNQAYFGILLGHAEGDVDADDYFLRDNENPPNDVMIPFGTSTGCLVYHSTRYVDFELTATTCYLVFERLVENKSGAAITVKQIGFSVAAAGNMDNPTLISRKNLGLNDFTIADGEKYRVRFKFGIEI